MSTLPTPNIVLANYEKNKYRGFAMSQLAKLKQVMFLGGLELLQSITTLGNGVVIKCVKCYNIEEIFITIPNEVIEESKSGVKNAFITRPRVGAFEIKSLTTPIETVYTFPAVIGNAWKVFDGKYTEEYTTSPYPCDLQNCNNEFLTSSNNVQVEIITEHTTSGYENIEVKLGGAVFTYRGAAGVGVPHDSGINIAGYTTSIRSDRITPVYYPASKTFYVNGNSVTAPFYPVGFGVLTFEPDHEFEFGGKKYLSIPVCIGIDDSEKCGVYINTTEWLLYIADVAMPIDTVFFQDNIAYTRGGIEYTISLKNKSIVGVVPASSVIELETTGIFNFAYSQISDKILLNSFMKDYDVDINLHGTTTNSGINTATTTIVAVKGQDLITSMSITGDAVVQSPYSTYTLNVVTDPGGPNYGYGATPILPEGCKPTWTNVDWVSDNGMTARVNASGCFVGKQITANLVGHIVSKTVSYGGTWSQTGSAGYIPYNSSYYLVRQINGVTYQEANSISGLSTSGCCSYNDSALYSSLIANSTAEYVYTEYQYVPSVTETTTIVNGCNCQYYVTGGPYVGWHNTYLTYWKSFTYTRVC